MEDGFKGRSVRGGAVNLVKQALKLVLTTLSTVVMARLLTPADFGLVAMVMPFVGFVSLFRDPGLSTITVQRSALNHVQLSALFWLSAGFSVALALVTCAAAPLIGQFYGDRRATWVAFSLALVFPISGLASQHRALMVRQMRFTILAVIELVSLILSVLIGIVAARQGLGYWSLVLMPASNELVGLVMVSAFSAWRPGRPRRFAEMRSILHFSLNFSGFNVLNYFARNMDNLLIGWRHGAMELALYSKAYVLLLLPLEQIRDPMTAVVVPALSRLQDHPDLLRTYYLRALNLFTSIALPMSVFMGIMSESIIRLILGEQWIGASRIVPVLAISSLVQSIYTPVGWLYISLGRVDRMLKWAAIALPPTVAAFIIGVRWGAFGVAVAYAVSSMLLTIPALWFAVQTAPVSLGDIGKALLGPAAIGLLLGVVLVVLKDRFALLTSDLRGLILASLVSVMVWLAADILPNIGHDPLGRYRELITVLRAE